MSPAIFTRKWLDKFQHFFETRVTPGPDNSKQTHLQWMCNLCVTGLAHIIVFNSQADEIILANPDFMPRAPSKAEKSALEENLRLANQKQGGFTSQDILAVWNHHPFAALGLVMQTVDGFVLRLKEIKYGDKLNGLPWQSLPLQYRQAMHEVFEVVERGEKIGTWPITAEQRKRGKEALAEKGW